MAGMRGYAISKYLLLMFIHVFHSISLSPHTSYSQIQVRAQAALERGSSALTYCLSVYRSGRDRLRPRFAEKGFIH